MAEPVRRPPLPAPDDDPVLARRRRIASISAAAKRVGYVFIGVSVVTFFVGLATDFPAPLVAISIASLAAACVILPLPIILAYGVKAADRADRGLPDGH